MSPIDFVDLGSPARAGKSPTDSTDDTDFKPSALGEQIDCERKICVICEICGRIKIVGDYE